MRRSHAWKRIRVAILAALLIVPFSKPASAVDLIGYVPYWEMNANYTINILPTQLSMLSEVRYFGLTAASNGTVVPQAGSGTMQTHPNNIATIQQKINALPADKRPRLGITIGGAGEDATFTSIA